jgi:hypothetical protein
VGASQTEQIFASSANNDDNDFDTDTGWWTKQANVTIPGTGVCVFTARAVAAGLYRGTAFLTVGKTTM